MTKQTLARACCSVMLLSIITPPVFAGQAPAAAQNAPPVQAAGPDTNALSTQATDPTAPLMTLSFLEDVRTQFHGSDDTGFEFRLQPVVPYKAWGASNILRVIVPYQATGPSNAGLKSVAIADLIVLPESWGRWGVGPVMSMDQSDSDKASKFSIGPAIGAVGSVSKKLSMGVFNQNLFASSVAITQIQPIIAYQLGSGWALSTGDLQLTYDWKQRQWVQLPIGFQIGVVRKIGGQAVRFAANPQWNLKDITGAVQSNVIFTIALLLPPT